jgi:hypothetical protein
MVEFTRARRLSADGTPAILAARSGLVARSRLSSLRAIANGRVAPATEGAGSVLGSARVDPAPERNPEETGLDA